MKQIVVVSGKGGTGKTFLTASLCAISENSCFADCDVDAANLYILLKPEVKEIYPFFGRDKAIILKDKCSKCGMCIELCKFNAIDQNYEISDFLCEGCKVCYNFCPEKAIELKENKAGDYYFGLTKYGEMVYGILGVAQETGGKLVSKIREKLKKMAEEKKRKYLIIDGPPGIGCPVISSIVGTSLVLVVTEPSISGIEDMKRVTELALGMKIEVKVVINKFDINLENTKIIEDYCKDKRIEVLEKIPYSKKVVKSILNCKPYVEVYNDEIKEKIISIWEKIK